MQIIYGHQAIKRDKLSFHCTKRSLLMMLVKMMTLMWFQACPLTNFSFYKNKWKVFRIVWIDLSPVHLKICTWFCHCIFFQKCRKNYKWWSDSILRKIWLDFVLKLFAKNIYVVKNTSSEIINCLDFILSKPFLAFRGH